MSVRSLITFGGGIPATTLAGNSFFLFPVFGVSNTFGAYQSTEYFWIAPRPGRALTILVASRVQGSIVGSTTVTGIYAFRVNGATSSLALTIVKDSDSAPWGGQVFGSASFSAGDRLSMRVSFDQDFDGDPGNIAHSLIVECF